MVRLPLWSWTSDGEAPEPPPPPTETRKVLQSLNHKANFNTIGNFNFFDMIREVWYEIRKPVASN